LLLLLLFANAAKPDCPKAGAEPAPDAQGEVLVPSCDDWPNAGFPKAGVDADGALPKELEPNTAPPVCDGGLVEPDDPHGDGLDPNCDGEPNAGAAVWEPKTEPPEFEKVDVEAGTGAAGVAD
jgi:hypothetical protein